MIFRRSNRSATCPAASIKNSPGRKSASPVYPRSSAECVIWYTCHATATDCASAPRITSSRAAWYSRKSRDRSALPGDSASSISAAVPPAAAELSAAPSAIHLCLHTSSSPPARNSAPARSHYPTLPTLPPSPASPPLAGSPPMPPRASPRLHLAGVSSILKPCIELPEREHDPKHDTPDGLPAPRQSPFPLSA